MGRRLAVISARLGLIGAILIFINILMIASQGSSLLLSPYHASSVQELLEASGPFWYRISFGIPSFVTGPLMVLWFIVSIINLVSAIFWNLMPERPFLLSFLVLVFSLCSFLAGGGFIFGSLLGVVGSSIGIQWRKIWKETFFGRFIRVLKFDSRFFAEIKENPKLLHEAVFTLIFINFLSGLGCGLYTFNVDRILSSSIAARQVLLLGETLLDISVLSQPIIYIGLSIIKWMLLSLILYITGSKLLGAKSKFDVIAQSIAFAYVPICFQIFLPAVFSNQPYLTMHWPLTIFFLTNFWMIFALIIAVKQLFEVETKNAIGIVMLVGSIYWLLTYKIITPIIFSDIPGIIFNIGPNEFVLALVSLATVLAFLFGVFKKH